jgi:hypothetical protein
VAAFRSTAGTSAAAIATDTAPQIAPMVNVGEVVAGQAGRDQAGSGGTGQDGDAERSAEFVEGIDQR